jgi:hypothetical protein
MIPVIALSSLVHIVYKRRQPDLHRRIAVLQTAALLLGYAAGKKIETGFGCWMHDLIFTISNNQQLKTNDQ